MLVGVPHNSGKKNQHSLFQFFCSKLKTICPIHVVTFTLISILATDYIQKRRRELALFSLEYNLSPNLSKSDYIE